MDDGRTHRPERDRMGWWPGAARAQGTPTNGWERGGQRNHAVIMSLIKFSHLSFSGEKWTFQHEIDDVGSKWVRFQ